jgi:hypothetical protein
LYVTWDEDAINIADCWGGEMKKEIVEKMIIDFIIRFRVTFILYNPSPSRKKSIARSPSWKGKILKKWDSIHTKPTDHYPAPIIRWSGMRSGSKNVLIPKLLSSIA